MRNSSNAPMENSASCQSVPKELMPAGYQSVSESESKALPEYQSITESGNYELPEYQNISEYSASLEYHNVSGSESSLKCQNTFDEGNLAKCRSGLKSLEDLNMLDSFLFSVSTEETKNAELIARIIIERATGIKLGEVIIETEKQFKGLDIDRRGIRLDLCISELRNGRTARVFDIEPNNYRYKSLPRRDRYYQSVTDAKLLGSGMETDELPEFISIWILPYDPFGENRMIYTVKNVVVENNQLVYNDGVMKFFLYTEGEYGGSDSLKSLLRYMSGTCKANAVDEELEKLQSIVEEVKHRREVGERYMTLQDMIDFEKEETGIITTIRVCHKVGLSKEETKDMLIEEYSLDADEAEKWIDDVMAGVGV